MLFLVAAPQNIQAIVYTFVATVALTAGVPLILSALYRKFFGAEPESTNETESRPAHARNPVRCFYPDLDGDFDRVDEAEIRACEAHEDFEVVDLNGGGKLAVRRSGVVRCQIDEDAVQIDLVKPWPSFVLLVGEDEDLKFEAANQLWSALAAHLQTTPDSQL
jgi:hypothetical protein